MNRYEEELIDFGKQLDTSVMIKRNTSVCHYGKIGDMLKNMLQTFYCPAEASDRLCKILYVFCLTSFFAANLLEEKIFDYTIIVADKSLSVIFTIYSWPAIALGQMVCLSRHRALEKVNRGREQNSSRIKDNLQSERVPSGNEITNDRKSAFLNVAYPFFDLYLMWPSVLRTVFTNISIPEQQIPHDPPDD
ncbi:hypothetical protein LOAG_05990 [Loa loa]|uniref:Uncharacterized protein n=1 Tax=Loa loa TaxID=7209 RepID=A0A1S0TYK6_LOALO|nr:hypothetical protein LOAG_05990 [Loa loa]EFO22497.1 hypothetical protein LOAG_05990 [Loa loa]